MDYGIGRTKDTFKSLKVIFAKIVIETSPATVSRRFVEEIFKDKLPENYPQSLSFIHHFFIFYITALNTVGSQNKAKGIN